MERLRVRADEKAKESAADQTTVQGTQQTYMEGDFDEAQEGGNSPQIRVIEPLVYNSTSCVKS